MAKSAKKQKVRMPGSIRQRLSAALCMLLISSIMLISATYAWFTLSTAPEVSNIATSVAGNGSLEIALMPASGSLSAITSGNSSESSSVDVTTANTTWGNIVELTDVSYGLSAVNLLPATLNTTGSAVAAVDLEAAEEEGEEEKDKVATSVPQTTYSFAGTTIATPDSPLATAVFGEDGRIAKLNANTSLASYSDGKFTALTAANPGYGVRAIGTFDDENSDAVSAYGMTTYGYVVDLAVRLNTTNTKTVNGETSAVAGNLLLQTEAAQRIYSGSENDLTQGSGSTMTFTTTGDGGNIAGLMKAIRVTFVSNYGNATAESSTILGTAYLDMSNVKYTEDKKTATAPLYLMASATEKQENAILTSLNKNAATQISAIVWLDGNSVSNSDLGTAAQSMTGTLNLQFATDVELTPAQNTALKGITTTTTEKTESTGSETSTPSNEGSQQEETGTTE